MDTCPPRIRDHPDEFRPRPILGMNYVCRGEYYSPLPRNNYKPICVQYKEFFTPFLLYLPLLTPSQYLYQSISMSLSKPTSPHTHIATASRALNKGTKSPTTLSKIINVSVVTPSNGKPPFIPPPIYTLYIRITFSHRHTGPNLEQVLADNVANVSLSKQVTPPTIHLHTPFTFITTSLHLQYYDNLAVIILIYQQDPNAPILITTTALATTASTIADPALATILASEEQSSSPPAGPSRKRQTKDLPPKEDYSNFAPVEFNDCQFAPPPPPSVESYSTTVLAPPC